MKKFTKQLKSIALLTLMGAFMTSCVNIIDQGPRGRNGKVYYGIDYDYNPIYSYWDNNDNIPLNPYFGEMYRTDAGTYDFEYFINPYEYWYGTYTLRMERGRPGEANNVAGQDGDDTYLLMICNDDGFYFEEWEDRGQVQTTDKDGFLVIDGANKSMNYTVKMKKTTVSERAPVRETKFKRAE